MVEQTSDVPELYFDEVLDTIEAERAILTAERDAFEGFLDTVRSITPQSASGQSVRPIHTRSGSNDPFQSLRTAYESTVMAVPHYDDEYGESYEENIRAEYGPDIATLLITGHVFERHHKQAVTVATEDVIEQRRRLLDALDEEQQSIERFREPLESVTDTIESLETGTLTSNSPKLLDGYRRRLDVLESRCHDLVERRQSEIVDDRRALSLSINCPDIPSYLYTELPVTYPVIAPLTAALETAFGIDAEVRTEQSASS